jgi:hypothetical protein
VAASSLAHVRSTHAELTALLQPSTLAAAGGCLLAIGLGGWLFWKLVRVMGRIQASERAGRETSE